MNSADSVASFPLETRAAGGGAWDKGLVAPHPVRLLKLVTMFACGGTERQVVNLACMLDRSRFDLRFACLKRWGHFLEEIERRRIPVSEYRIDSLYKPKAFRQQIRLARDIRRNRIHIVHSYNFYTNVFAVPAARLAGVPVVIASIRDRGVYLSPAQKFVQKHVCRLADRVLVNAESIGKWLADDGVPEDKISVIRNGIDLSGFEPGPDGAGVRRSLGVPANAPLVVMLSRLNPQKGVDYFLEAAAEVGRRRPDARFLVVGEKLVNVGGVIQPDVDYRRALEQRAARLGLGNRIVFTGFRSDVPALLSECSVSVLPSLSEGLSNTLIESMAAGVPVVATDVGGNPEVVRHGAGGILVPPRDSRALAEAVDAILRDPVRARQLGREARRQARERFSLERMVRDTQDLYANLLQSKRR